MLCGYTVEYAPLKKLVATARLDNIASQKILQNMDFKEKEQLEKYGALRSHFEVSAKQIRNNYHRFFHQRDMNENRKAQSKFIDNGVDVTIDEMTRSAFGRQSHTAGKRQSV